MKIWIINSVVLLTFLSCKTNNNKVANSSLTKLDSMLIEFQQSDSFTCPAKEIQI